MSIPMRQEDMDSEFEGLWYEHQCFTNMGVHYFNLNYEPNQDCNEIIPFQVRRLLLIHITSSLSNWFSF